MAGTTGRAKMATASHRAGAMDPRCKKLFTQGLTTTVRAARMAATTTTARITPAHRSPTSWPSRFRRAVCRATIVWSARPGTGLNSYFGRQLLYIGIGLAVFLVAVAFDYHFYSDYIILFYLGGIAVLVLTLVTGRTIHNSKSWISLGSVALQPSELVKVAAIVALAKYYSGIERDYLDLRDLIVGGIIVLAPMLLVVAQGDLGTAVTFAPIFVANLVFAQRFSDVHNSGTAFAVNLLGAMAGGALEYLSLITGYRVLLIVIAVLYGLAFVTSLRGRPAPLPH